MTEPTSVAKHMKNSNITKDEIINNIGYIYFHANYAGMLDFSLINKENKGMKLKIDTEEIRQYLLSKIKSGEFEIDRQAGSKYDRIIFNR